MCGIVGVKGHPDAVKMIILSLNAIQHRGEEGVGICVSSADGMKIERRLGWVQNNFDITALETIKRLKGNSAVGHVRYSTSGGKNSEEAFENIQPILVDLAAGKLAVAHNGNFTNAETIRKTLKKERGCIFLTTSDTEAVLHLAAQSKNLSLIERIIEALRQIEGAYSLIFLSQKKLIGVRDPFGIRPLCLGKVDGAYILASETCAFDVVGAEFLRDIEPGEIVVIENNEIKSYFPFPKVKSRSCVFEIIYFSRPDSDQGRFYEKRKRIGAQLAKESKVGVDFVVSVPDSSDVGALGFAEEAGFKYERCLIRSHYFGRTFIQPKQEIRDFGTRLKYNPVRHILKGKRIIVIDDSIVRSTTASKIIRMMRDAGAEKVHYRVFSPPVISPCFYGIDMSAKEELIAAKFGGNIEKIREAIGADSLDYLSLDGLYKAVTGEKRNDTNPRFCDACFTGEYPTPLTDFKY